MTPCPEMTNSALPAQIGPLISKRQRDRVASFVERASEQKHIEITTGGKPPGGQIGAQCGAQRPSGLGQLHDSQHAQ